MEEQQRLPVLHINDSRGVNPEDFGLGTAEQTSVDTPSRTIPFDDDYTPSWLVPIARFFSDEEATRVQTLHCPVVEFSVDEEESHNFHEHDVGLLVSLITLIRPMASSIMDPVILASLLGR